MSSLSGDAVKEVKDGSGDTLTKRSLLVTENPFESVTFAVTGKVPVAVGWHDMVGMLLELHPVGIPVHWYA
jgi:hypothetical protein